MKTNSSIASSNTLPSASRERPEAVTERYSPEFNQKGMNPNVVKLRALMRFFGLTPTEVAKTVGVSRPYVARILSVSDSFVGSDDFWRRLEGRLGELVANRATQVFSVRAISVVDVEAV